MNKVGISILKMSSRRHLHPRCFSSLLDDNCDFLIRTIDEDHFTNSRYHGLIQLVHMGYEYIGWVDDDDEMVPNIFSELLDVFNRFPDTSIAFAEQIIRTDNNDYHFKLSENRGGVDIYESISDMHQPVLIRSDIFNKYSYILHNTRYTERSLYKEIRDKEPQMKIRCLYKPGYIYNKRTG